MAPQLVHILCLVTVLHSFLPVAFGGLPCEESGYCSLGKVQRYRGDISNSSEFRKMLQQVSYKREIILTTSINVGNELHIEELVQLHVQVEERLGFSHFLVLSTIPRSCDELSVHRPDASCAWDTSPNHKKGFFWSTHLWHLRWRFFARAIRLRYNIMSLDSDYSMFRDPYIYLKQPPFNKVQMLGVAEGICGANGGFMYVHNALPDGPVAWIFQRMTELPLRWMDDDFAHLITFGKMKPGGEMCLTFDQMLLDDAIHCAMSGKPYIWRYAMEVCTPETWRAPDNSSSKREVMALQRKITNCEAQTHRDNVPQPASWNLPTPPDFHLLMQTWPLKVPRYDHVNASMPARMGGPFYSSKGGIYSDAFLRQLRDDCATGECDAWLARKTYWGNSTLVAYPQAPRPKVRETLGFVPKWLSTTSYWMRNGLLTPLDGSPAKAVTLHGHVGAPGSSKMVLKRAVRKIYGSWDWNASKRLHKVKGFEKTGPYFAGPAPDRVIALSPHIDLSKTKSELEMKRIVIGLMQVGILTNRTVVIPDIPCETPWVIKIARERPTLAMEACAGKRAFVLEQNLDLIPYAFTMGNPALDSGKLKGIGNYSTRFRFVTSQMLSDWCLFRNWATKQGGMIPIELVHWLEADAPPGTQKAPGPSNTVLATGDPKLADTPGAPDGSPFEHLVQLSPDAVAAELKKFDAQPLVFLGHPVVLDMSGGTPDPPWPKGAQLENFTDWRRMWRHWVRECVIGSLGDAGFYLTPEQLPKKGAVDSLGDARRGVIKDGKVHLA